ncbi:hypothetical protein GUJ93_ZPchr0006g43646 [Zizania palustris]|uniref:Uncharacterized protein n=1 Tax=Zizania palustris TaxID=103762 RepID=A0A8J5T0S1_ZIZPA|nr:hypothetical protein GUJ93_ZPchr0006g43646 [Zizania palustris]
MAAACAHVGRLRDTSSSSRLGAAPVPVRTCLLHAASTARSEKKLITASQGTQKLGASAGQNVNTEQYTMQECRSRFS